MPLRKIITPIGPSIAYLDLNRGLFALIDSDDVDLVSRSSWNAQLDKTTGNYYAKARMGGNNIMLHRFLYPTAKDYAHIDHKNLRTLDCRKSNLRGATHTQSRYNTRKSKNSKSPYKGVSKRGNRWVSSIQNSGKKISLGSHTTAEMAHAAYCKAATHFAGEFARFE